MLWGNGRKQEEIQVKWHNPNTEMCWTISDPGENSKQKVQLAVYKLDHDAKAIHSALAQKAELLFQPE